MNAKERMKNRIREHGENLTRIFFNVTDDPVTLCKRIHRLEVKAHRLSTDWCNGDIDEATWDTETKKILATLDKIIYFKARNIPIFINGDARGYALKIDDKWMRNQPEPVKLQTDWGGYGILAPEFDGKR